MEGAHRSGDVHSDAALYGVDALEPEEVRAFEAHLDTCSRCREEVSSFQRTAEGLAEAVAVEPPAELKAQVFRAIDRDTGREAERARQRTRHPDRNSETDSQAKLYRFETKTARRNRWLLAAAAIILAPGLALGGWSLGHQAGNDGQQVTAERQHEQQR
ncbi:MAG: zf-HC2 domain-containing protein, partial [Kocuria sp.]|nr:zf-HC2 domain-containing protein [Kocuria sp.]